MVYMVLVRIKYKGTGGIIYMHIGVMATEVVNTNINARLLLCDDWRNRIAEKVAHLQSLSEKIKMFEDLYRFGDMGVLDKSFAEDLEWLHQVWLSEPECSIDVYEEIDEQLNDIENKLECLPFETAVCYREPENIGKTDINIVKNAFKGENVSWRFHPSIVKHMPLDDRERIFRHFEYMYYFVINVRDELQFDIESLIA